jgi:hypothetical protein
MVEDLVQEAIAAALRTHLTMCCGCGNSCMQMDRIRQGRQAYAAGKAIGAQAKPESSD